MRFILFKRVEVADDFDPMMMMFFRQHRKEVGEDWKGEDDKKYSLRYVGECTSRNEVVTHVQSDSKATFVLFHGVIEELKCAIPILVGGKNFSTLEAEWGTNPAPKKTQKVKVQPKFCFSEKLSTTKRKVR